MQQPPRHDADTPASLKHPEHEVVVLRPTAIAIAQLEQHGAPNQQRGMRDRTFHEGFALQPFGRADRAKPMFIAKPALAQHGTREQPHVATYRRKCRALLESEAL